MDDYDKHHNINIARCMYRRKYRKCVGYILENIMMDGIWVKVLGSILYRNNVVGGVVNFIDDIYGGRTSLFLTSQRMPAATDAYTCLYKRKFIGIENIYHRYFCLDI